MPPRRFQPRPTAWAFTPKSPASTTAIASAFSAACKGIVTPALSQQDAPRYIRAKVDQLLAVMGTCPLRSEELDDDTLIALDPIGIIAESFQQVIDHLNETNQSLSIATD